MKNVLDFLESVGANSAVNRLDVVEFEAFVSSMAFNADINNALLNRDTNALESATGNQNKFVCMVFVPDTESSKLKIAA